LAQLPVNDYGKLSQPATQARFLCWHTLAGGRDDKAIKSVPRQGRICLDREKGNGEVRHHGETAFLREEPGRSRFPSLQRKKGTVP
jgi:hypothetical protein